MHFTKFPAFFLFAAAIAAAQTTPPATGGPANSDQPVKLDAFVVSGNLDRAREDLVPSLGASSFAIDKSQIDLMPLGANGSFSQVLLRAPGVAQDSEASGGVHVRGEHANLQYRINDILLPEGISGFGSELDPRFVSTMQLVTGSLPAQYGFRTAGVVDIHTQSGGGASGGQASLFAGGFNTLRPAVDAFGTRDGTSYFLNASYDQNDLGIENPTASRNAIHDTTRQTKAFAYLSRVLDPSSRISAIASVSDGHYQLPNTPDLPAGTAPDGTPWLPGTFDSTRLNENQHEQNAYAVLAYQKTTGDLSYQAAAFGRYSRVHFVPDPTGDLFFNGAASDVDRRVHSGGLQWDGRVVVGGNHTLRGGLMFLDERLHSHTNTVVFPVDANGHVTGPQYPVIADVTQHADFFGVYLQDEWKPLDHLTLNYGARLDAYSSSTDHESQFSPRLNLIWQITSATSLHTGYARYFTPPPLENVPASTVAQFAGTSNAAGNGRNDPVKAERAHYFDAGVSHDFGNGWEMGLDGYYKHAREQLDDGLFGQTLILSAFNYRLGRIYGLEFSSSYTAGAFSSYLNLSHSVAQGKDWNSAQFQFDPADLAYVRNHWIHLDHDQALSASLGASYVWHEAGGRSTKVFADAIYGSGLRHDATGGLGQTIPNGGTLPSYATANLGVEQTFTLADGKAWKIRLDIMNLADAVYQLRDGSGVGVNAAQYGKRRSVFGTVSYTF